MTISQPIQTACVGTIVVGAACMLYALGSLPRQAALPKGPRDPPLVPLSAEEVKARLHDDSQKFITELSEKYGSVFTVHMPGGKKMTYVLDPSLYGSVLRAPWANFNRISRQSKLRFGLDDIVKTELHVGKLSNYMRKSMANPHLDKLYARFQMLFAHFLHDSLPKAGSTDLLSLIFKTTFASNLDMMFGDDTFSEKMLSDFRKFDNGIGTRSAGSKTGIDEGDPTAAGDRFADFLNASGRENMAAIVDEAATLLSTPDDVGNVFSPRRARHRGCPFAAKTGSKDRSLKRFKLMLAWATNINSVPTSFWMTLRVLKDPKLVEDIANEYAAKIGVKPVELVTRKELGKLKLLSSVLEEVFRVHSMPNVYREVDGKDGGVIDGKFRVKNGDWIALYPRFGHHNADVFENPEEFKADRFVGRPKFTYKGRNVRKPVVVFGGGRNPCPGQELARCLMKITVLQLVLTYRFKLKDADVKIPAAVRGSPSSTPPPEKSVEVVCERLPEKKPEDRRAILEALNYFY